jgi:PhzF family phenazine biosynthesis protein
MNLPIFQVDTFTSDVFTGNPAAVCPLEYWLEDEVLQAIAAENNVSETAFFVDRGDYYQLRWFTPQMEATCCGHGTLAAAFIISTKINPDRKKFLFGTHKGELAVSIDAKLISITFPSQDPISCEAPGNLLNAFNIKPQEVLAANYYMAVYENEDQIKSIKPYMALIKELDRLGVIVTAPGKDYDFVSRFFAPSMGVPEDSVSSSAHCILTPFWAKKLNKNRLTAYQLSKRGGELNCQHIDHKAIISGKTRLYMEGNISI